MSELAVTLLRVGYLVLLWAFVFAAIAVLRRDIFAATRVTPRGRGRRTAPASSASPRSAATPALSAASPGPAPTPVPGASAAPSPAPAPSRQSIAKPPTRLVVTSGTLSGTSVPLGQSAIVIGRAQSCTLVLDDDFASSRHARLFPDGDSWSLEDLGSTNGTVLDQHKIERPTRVGVGSIVRIGRTVMELRR